MRHAAAEIMEELRGSGIQLWSEAGRLRYRAPAGAMTEPMKARLGACRDDLLRLLSDGVTRRLGSGPVPLTPGQEAIWVAERSGAAGDAFHIPVALELTGALDCAALLAAFARLTRRHQALRARLCLVGDRLHLDILADAELPWSELSPADVAAFAARRFALDGPLWRVGLVRRGAAVHLVVIVLHHLIGDGGAVDALLRDLFAGYGAPDQPDGEVLGCADLATWTETRRRSGAWSAALAYWATALEGAAIPLDLLPDRSATEERAADQSRTRLPAVTVAALRRIAAATGTTLFTALWTLLAMLLQRAGAGDDIVIAAPVLGRTRPELAGVIGLLANRIALRADLAGELDFRTLLCRTGATTRAALAQAEVPFELIAPGRPDPNVIFALQNAITFDGAVPGLGLRGLEIASRTAKAELYLAAEEAGDAIHLTLEFPPARFDRARMAGLLGLYVRLAEAATAAPDRPIGRLPLATPAERAALLAAGIGRATPAPSASIAAAFEAMVARFARHTAVVAAASWEDPGGQSLTYAELNAAADGLAARLADAGPVIAVALPRSARLIVALLAILKIGAAYLPLDQALPPARAAELAKAADATWLVTDAAAAPDFAAGFARVVDAGERGERRVQRAVGADALAYVLFTSGSSGAPKGVAVTHGNVLHFVAGLPRPGPRPAVVLQFAPVEFDASVMEIFGALLTGARLLVAPPGLPGLDQLAGLIRRGGVTCAWLTAGLFHGMVEADPGCLCGLDHLIAGGDVLAVDRVRALFAAGPRGVVANGYGPTETTILAAYHAIRPEDLLAGAIPIGAPLGATRLYVLDRHGEPVAPGLPGELWIGGDGVAAGYIGADDLTAERFRPDPFAAGRMYRSGDRARWRADGALEFLGRLDQQIKLRGFRIEPAEVEVCLRTHAAVTDAVVVLHQGRLVAYVVAGDPPTGDALAAHLAERLPAYMVPTQYVVLAALQLTASGKVDRRSLPAPPIAAGGMAAPQGAAERVLTAIWCELLHCERVAPDAHFFELGGDSIMAMQVVMRAARAGWRIAAADVLRHHSIRALAAVARPASAARPAVDRPARLPLTPIQHWFFALDMPDRVPWNQAVRLVLDPAIAPPRLQAALDALEACHPALRLRFGPDGGARIAPPGTVAIQQGQHCDAVHAGVDLRRGPVWRAAILPGGDLLLTVHHLAIDGVSWRILLDDFAALLRAPGELPAPPGDLHDWAAFLARRRPAAAAEEPFWLGRPAAPGLCLPPGDAAAVEANTDIVSLRLDPALTADLLGPANLAWQTAPIELLLAGLCLGYQDATGAAALLIDLEHHGRDAAGAPDLSRTLGWFTSIAPVALRWPEAPADCAAAIKAALRALPDHGIGYLLLRQDGPAAIAAQPRPSVSVNYLGRIDSVVSAAAPFRLSDAPVGRVLHPAAVRPYAVEIVALAGKARLQIDWRFTAGAAAGAAIAAWARASEAAWRRIVAAALGQSLGGVSPRDIEATWPASPQQLGVLLQSLAQPGDGLHVEQLVLTLRGAVDATALRQAWAGAIAALPALRTGFDWAARLQIVRHAAVPEWVEDDWSGRDWQVERDRFLSADRSRGFALEAPPLLRLALFRTGPATWLHIWSFHHILLDGWSVPLVLRAVLDGCAPPQHPGAYPAWLAAQDAPTDAAFWRRELAGLPPPRGFAAPAVPGAGHDSADLALPADLAARLRRVARAHRVTMNTLVQGAWGLLLAAGGDDDPVFGMTVSGRPAELEDSETMVGLFINSLPLRPRPPASGSPLAWLPVLQAHADTLRRHEHCTAGQIHGWSGRPAAAALFDTLVVFENYPMELLHQAASSGGVVVTEVETVGARTAHPVVLLAMAGGTRFRLITSRARLRAADAARLLAGLACRLEALADDRPIEDLPQDMPARAIAAAAVAGRMPFGSAELSVARLWQQVLGAGVFGAEQNFFELGGHSLLGLELLRRWKLAFGAELPLATFLRAPTIAGLARHLAGREAAPDERLIALAEGADRLFLAPGAGGNPFAYLPLARALAPATALVAFEPDELLDAGATSIEALGTAFAAAVARWQPAGPLRLAGHSLGAAIAYQAALELRAQGREIALLGLIDLAVPGAPPDPRDEAAWLADIAEAIGRYFAIDLHLSAAVLSGLAPPACRRRVLDALVGAGILPMGSDPALIAAMLQRYRRGFGALAAWRPAASDLAAVVIRSAGSAAELGWEQVCPVVGTVTVPGDHISMITAPFAHRLAKALSECA